MSSMLPVADRSGDYAGISAIHINLRGSRVATAQLVQTSIQLKLDVLFIQDPYVKEGKVAGFPLGWFIATCLSVSCAIVIVDKRLQVVMSDRFFNSVFVNISDRASVLKVGTQYSTLSVTLQMI